MRAEWVSQEDGGVSVAIAGSGGSGAVTAGRVLLEAAATFGLYGLLMRSAGPQIRGGESASLLRLDPRPVACLNDAFDILVGLDWLNAGRFADEIPLRPSSLILADPAAASVPETFAQSGARVEWLPFAERTAEVDEGRLNMTAMGSVGARLGIPQEAMVVAVRAVLAGRGEVLTEAAARCVALGYRMGLPQATPVWRLPEEAAARWCLTGNQACGLGALRGGVRFVSGYPITPASEILEWLAPRLERLGGTLIQAEDELASINMAIGASYGGTPALTATSGPGLSLMLEGLGLSVASETPVVVIDVARAGPSTGIPTKSEQADLDVALFGLHGDAPHLVLAPLDVGDCAFTTQWAVRLAEHLQTAVLVLSDQSLGQARAVTRPSMAFDIPLDRRVEVDPTQYRRYRRTEDGISPMAVPGATDGMYTAEGLEHDDRGVPSSLVEDHWQQLEKRRRKVEDFDYGSHWGVLRGSGELCLVCWGSSSGAVLEAAERLETGGLTVRVIALRLLAPLPRVALEQALTGAVRVWVVEQNQGGQLYHYLKSYDMLPASARLFARPGPLPLRPGEIVQAVTDAV